MMGQRQQAPWSRESILCYLQRRCQYLPSMERSQQSWSSNQIYKAQVWELDPATRIVPCLEVLAGYLATSSFVAPAICSCTSITPGKVTSSCEHICITDDDNISLCNLQNALWGNYPFLHVWAKVLYELMEPKRKWNPLWSSAFTALITWYSCQSKDCVGRMRVLPPPFWKTDWRSASESVTIRMAKDHSLSI